MSAYAFRTAILKKLGGCREWFVTSEDADLQFRLAEVARVGYVPRNAYLYRLHDASITHSQRSVQRLFFEQMSRDFLRQRRERGQDDLQLGNPPAVPGQVEDEHGPRDSASHIQEILIGESWSEHASGNKRHAMGIALRACFAKPTNLGAWKSLLMIGFKRAGQKSDEASPVSGMTHEQASR
jgi:hypothetical protein